MTLSDSTSPDSTSRPDSTRSPMQLRVVHTTGFEYDGKAVASFNEARLTPQTTQGQIVPHARLEVSPTPWSYGYRDYWGTAVTAFEVHDPHETLTITSTATVHTDRPTPGAPRLTWEQVADEGFRDRHIEVLEIPDRVAPPGDLKARVLEVGKSATTPTEAALEVSRLVNAEVEYVVGATDVASHAADAWVARSGVCQDMAHLVVGSLRTLGIPARYVSGYLHPLAEAAVGEPVRGESHAWVEWWDEGWRGFDPTSNSEVGNLHISVAAGRDYTDVRPLSGIFSGAVTARMFVDVSITRLA